MDKIALIDLDNTVCDWDKAMIRDLKRCLPPEYWQRSLGPHTSHLDAWMTDERRNRPEWVENLMSVIRTQAGWWVNLEPLPIGMAIFDIIKSSRWNWEVNVLTKGPATKPAAWAEKVQWCLQHLGDIPVTVCADKSIVYGRVLVDDYPPYMEQWLKHRPNGLGIMPAHQYNEGFAHPNVIRATFVNLDLVIKVLDLAWKRKEGDPLILP